MRFRRGNDSGGTHITGHRNQVNTGRVGGDMRQIQVSGAGTNDPQVLAARVRLAELTAALDAHAGDVYNIDGCRTAVARMDEELRSTSPGGRRLIENLDMLNLAIGSVESLASLASSLKEAIEAVVG